jgi:choice-of-anchor A domain-containing protein
MIMFKVRPIALSIVLALTSMASGNSNRFALAQTQCTPLPLGAANEFNVFITQGDLIYMPHAEGRVAVAGNATLQNFGIGSDALQQQSWPLVGNQLSNNPSRFDLIVGGNISLHHGRVMHGSVQYGGTASVNNVSFIPGAGAQQGTSIDFPAELARFRDLRDTWRNLPVNGTPQIQVGSTGNIWNMQLTGSNPNVNVFNVSGADLNRMRGTINFNVPAGSSVIVNVDGQTLNLTGYGVTGIAKDKLLWNFHQATRIDVNGIGFHGSLFAPDANLYSLENTGAGLDGAVIVASYTQNNGINHGEPHNFPFTGCLPTTPVRPTPQPTSPPRPTAQPTTPPQPTVQPTTPPQPTATRPAPTATRPAPTATPMPTPTVIVYPPPPSAVNCDYVYTFSANPDRVIGRVTPSNTLCPDLTHPFGQPMNEVLRAPYPRSLVSEDTTFQLLPPPSPVFDWSASQTPLANGSWINSSGQPTRSGLRRNIRIGTRLERLADNSQWPPSGPNRQRVISTTWQFEDRSWNARRPYPTTQLGSDLKRFNYDTASFFPGRTGECAQWSLRAARV